MVHSNSTRNLPLLVVYVVYEPFLTELLAVADQTIGNKLQEAGYSTHQVNFVTFWDQLGTSFFGDQLGTSFCDHFPSSFGDLCELSGLIFGRIWRQFGKWHQGFFVKEHTPIYRGFNSSYGFLTGGEDHYSEATICGAPVCGEHHQSIDIWDSDKPGYMKNGTWSAQLFVEAAQAVIRGHDPSTPLFFYFALHNTHGPTQGKYKLRLHYYTRHSKPGCQYCK